METPVPDYVPPATAANEGIRKGPILIAAIFTAAIIGAGAYLLRDKSQTETLPKFYDTPAFSLTDQNAQTITNETLKGHPWVCDFIYTTCSGPCPMMSAQMVSLQKTIGDPSVRFVSFSLDPDHDTPQQLKQYAEEMNKGETRWLLLTGSADALYGLARGLHLTAIPAHANQPIQHDERFLLIDAAGHVRGIYAYSDPEKMAQLPADLRELLKESK